MHTTVEEFIELNEDLEESEIESLLKDFFKAIPTYYMYLDRHDASGYFCHEAGSEQCIALGHYSDKEKSLEECIDIYYPEDLHESGWYGDLICPETKHSVACTYCEGDCDYNYGSVESIWNYLGVAE